MAKERSINPATAALKASKKKEIKKSKANLATQRAEKIARRNPHRIQKQIDELKEAQSGSGALKPRDKQALEALEKDLKAVLKAREVLGDKAPEFRAPREVLGKRRRDDEQPVESETDEDVQDIPMPKDTENMPPIPRRKPRNAPVQQTGAEKPKLPSQSVYESAPVIKDLRKEAVRTFMPSSVARNIHAKKDDGNSNDAFKDAEKVVDEALKEAEFNMMTKEEEGGYTGNASREGEIAERELRRVEVEDVEDDGY